MSDVSRNQFNLLLRLLVAALGDIRALDVAEQKDRKIEKLIAEIRKSIVD